MKAKHEVEVSGKSIVGRFLEYLQLITSIIANLFTVFGVLVALAVLITGLYPQMVAKNDNHFAKANAGDTYSQMFLAEHFYEIGEYDEAIYWYKIASAAENDYSYYACNNLACLYANGYGLSDYEQSGYRRFDIAVSLFEKARELPALQNDNIKILLAKTVKNDYIENNYNILAEKYGLYEGREQISAKYASSERYLGSMIWDGNTRYLFSGTYIDVSENKMPQGLYRYYVVEYAENDNASEYKEYAYNYIYLKDMNITKDENGNESGESAYS